MGAGLPTQRDGQGLNFCFLFVIQDAFFELRSFSWGHRFEEGSHLLHSCFNWLSVGRLGAVSGIVSLLSTHVTRSSYVCSVLPTWRVGYLRGARSTGCHVVRRWDCSYVLAYPSQECNSSGCHVVVHVPFVHLVPCLPDVLCRSGFRKRSQV